MALAIAREPTQRLLTHAREWLERNARTIAAVILLQDGVKAGERKEVTP